MTELFYTNHDDGEPKPWLYQITFAKGDLEIKLGHHIPQETYGKIGTEGVTYLLLQAAVRHLNGAIDRMSQLGDHEDEEKES